MKKLKHITKVCQELYEEKGQSAVFDYVNERDLPNVQYEYCKACDTDSPAWEHQCLVCGQKTEPIEKEFDVDGEVTIDDFSDEEL
jgi:hypothetical protein